LVFAPKVPTVGSRGRKPVVRWRPHHFPHLRRALAVGANAGLKALPTERILVAACRHFYRLTPPRLHGLRIRDFEVHGEGRNRSALPTGALASGRNADAPTQPNNKKIAHQIGGLFKLPIETGFRQRQDCRLPSRRTGTDLRLCRVGLSGCRSFRHRRWN
jgi:hypothetical protein